MRCYISADIEGVTGIAHWNEATEGRPGYEIFRSRFENEVSAVCAGAIAGGAGYLLVQDAHDSARNLNPEAFPLPVTLSRGWSGHPHAMIQDMDSSYDAFMMVGWHSGAGSGGTPLAHSMHTGLTQMQLNGCDATEFRLHAWLAAELGVPSVFLSGDAHLCKQARDWIPSIITVETHDCQGGAVRSKHPAYVRELMKESAQEAMALSASIEAPSLPKVFELKIRYAKDADAFKASFYPGAKRSAPHCVDFEGGSMKEIFQAMLFLL
jgi:D-amino peptidase